MKQENIWLDSARRMVREHGFIEAKRLCTQYRDMSSEGTASFAFHNAVLKQIISFYRGIRVPWSGS